MSIQLGKLIDANDFARLVLFLFVLIMSACIAQTKTEYGIVPGYDAYCQEHHDDRNINAGGLYKILRTWDSSLYTELPKEKTAGKSEPEIGYFTREQALKECKIHKQDFPGHPCRIRKAGYAVSGMG